MDKKGDLLYSTKIAIIKDTQVFQGFFFFSSSFFPVLFIHLGANHSKNTHALQEIEKNREAGLQDLEISLLIFLSAWLCLSMISSLISSLQYDMGLCYPQSDHIKQIIRDH